MGYCVISQVSIDVYDGTIPEKTMDRIKAILKEEGVYGLHCSHNCITFDASGNKWIDYEFLEKIKQLLKDNKMVKSFEITASEYIESCDGGYHYNSGEDEDNDVKDPLFPNNEE